MEEQTLRIEIPSCFVSKDTSEDPEWTNLDFLNGWTPVLFSGAPSTILGWQGSIDLSGYARDYKTFYPDGGVIQEGPYYNAKDGSGQTICTVVSSVPIDLEQFSWMLLANSTPGLMVDTLTTGGALGTASQNWETTIFCETQVNLINANLPALGICQPIYSKQTGSLSPTAAQVLYVAKIVIPSTLASGTGTNLSIPASRVILPGKMDQEPELNYMMRLSRSIELANQV